MLTHVKTDTNECVLSDTTVGSSATGTELAVDRSGWMMSRVLDVKQTSRSVDIEDGEVTTAVTLRTSLYRVNPQVRNFWHNCRYFSFAYC